MHKDRDDLDGPSAQQFDPLLVAWRHKWLIAFCALVGVGLGYLHYCRQTPIYESTATLLVVPETSSSLPIEQLDSTRGSDEGLSTQMILIRSPLVIDKAARHPDLAKVASLASSGNAAQLIAAGLSVSQARAANGYVANEVLELRFSGTSAEDCPKVLTIVIDAYQEFLGETRQSISAETVSLITKAKDSLLKDLTEKEAAFRDFRKNSPLIWQGESAKNIHVERLAQVESARTELLIAQSNLRAQIDSLQSTIQSGTRQEVLQLLASQMASSTTKEHGIQQAMFTTTPSTLDEQVKALVIEEHLLQERFGSRHPRLLELQRRLQITEKILREMRDDKVQTAGTSNNETDIVTLFMDSLKQELAVTEQRASELDALFAKEVAAARNLESSEIENATRAAEIQRTQQLFEGVVRRLEEISLIKDVGGTYTQIIAEPYRGVQILPRLTTTIASAAMVALAFGFGLGALLEISNRGFRSADDLASGLGVNIIGQYPDQILPPSEVANPLLDRSIVTYHKPASQLTEIYRHIRTSLYFSDQYREKQAKIIQITSPLPGDGKTTLTANLGVVMAQAGKSVLLLEADLRLPRLARMFGRSAEKGLSAVLTQSAELNDCIISTDVPNLFLLPVGKRPSNPSELLTSSFFKQLMDIVRDKFDIVLVDSPPLLPITDASVIAASVDGVMLLLRLRKSLRGAAMASLSKLKAVNARLLGVVVHGQFAGERRDDPYYGYGYTYGTGSEHAPGSDEESGFSPHVTENCEVGTAIREA